MRQSFFILFFLFTLAACNSGGGGGSSDPGPTFAVSGTLTYDYVPIESSGLDYESTSQRPVRNVYIEAKNAANHARIASGYTDDSGAFTLNVPQSVTNFYIGAFSQLKSPSIRVEDNTNNNAIYMAASSDFENTGDQTLSNINIQSGWNGTNSGGSYSGTRASAPFAILDSVYSTILKMKTAKPNLSFPALKINWSIANAPIDGDVADGFIGTSHYDGSELYILGLVNADTDEFDRHVIVHEFGHYVEDKLGRSDSIGGAHGPGDKLNIAVAFSEAWGNALSAMIFDPDIVYLDSASSNQQTIQISFDLESDTDSSPGWYSEISNQELIFDVYDSASGGSDNIALGLGPILDVITGPLKTTPALTSIFSFFASLKTNYPAEVSNLDTLVTSKSIEPVQDIYGTGETNDGGMNMALPIYNQLVLNGGAIATELAGSPYRVNQAENNRYFRFTAGSSTTKLNWTATRNFGVIIFQKGKMIIQGTTNSLNDSINFTTASGQIYVIEIIGLSTLASNSVSISVQGL